jgi:hypothetical protein
VLPPASRTGGTIIGDAGGSTGAKISVLTTTSSLAHIPIFNADMLLPLAYLGNGREAISMTFNVDRLSNIVFVESTGMPTIQSVVFNFKYHMITIIPTSELQLKVARLVENNKFLFPLDAYNFTSTTLLSGEQSKAVRLNCDEESVKKVMVMFQKTPSAGLSDTYDPTNTFSNGSCKTCQLKVGTMTYPQNPITRRFNVNNVRDATNFMKEVSTANYDYQDKTSPNIRRDLFHDVDSDPQSSGQFKIYVSLDSGCESIYSGTNVRELGSNVDVDLTFGADGAFDGDASGEVNVFSVQTNMYILQLDGLRKITKGEYYALVNRMNEAEQRTMNDINSVSNVIKK